MATAAARPQPLAPEAGPHHHHARPAWLQRVDPRSRILAAAAFSVLTAVAGRMPTLLLGLTAAGAAVAASGLRPGVVLRRLAGLNLLMLLLLVLMPWSTPGTPIFHLAGLEYTREGLQRVALVAVKGNALVLALGALVGTMEVSTLGHALNHLFVPEKLIHLLLFTVRYVDVLRREFHRLAWAMKLRAFQPRMNRHTYRAYGYLVGMLLVRSLDRSQRIVAAMKCRGFRGCFWLLDHFHYSRGDLRFALVTAATLGAMLWTEWH